MSQRPKGPALFLMSIPGTVFWILVGIGIYTEDTRFLNVAVVLLAVTFAGFGIRAWRRSNADSAETLRLWNEGTPATAKIVNIRKNGAFNDHPYVEFELEVMHGDAEPYALEHRALISQLAIPRIQPDAVIDIKVDPADKTKIVVDEKLTPYGYK